MLEKKPNASRAREKRRTKNEDRREKEKEKWTLNGRAEKT